MSGPELSDMTAWERVLLAAVTPQAPGRPLPGGTAAFPHSLTPAPRGDSWQLAGDVQVGDMFNHSPKRGRRTRGRETG